MKKDFYEDTKKSAFQPQKTSCKGQDEKLANM
jgi:hypothetical protein